MGLWLNNFQKYKILSFTVKLQKYDWFVTVIIQWEFFKTSYMLMHWIYALFYSLFLLTLWETTQCNEILFLLKSIASCDSLQNARTSCLSKLYWLAYQSWNNGAKHYKHFKIALSELFWCNAMFDFMTCLKLKWVTCNKQKSA